MNKQFDKLKQLRHFLLKEISELTNEQLNIIPAGFNNNIIWNLGHLLCAAQVICYRRAGVPLTVDENFITPFLPNSKPGESICSDQVNNIKELFISSIDKLQADYENNVFINYTKSENIERYYGIELLTIEDALEFLLYHEGFHSGRITALKRLA